MTHNPPVRDVRLHGVLGSKFGRHFRLAVHSTAEAMRALCVMLPGFEAYMMQAKDKGMAFAVYLDKNNIGQNELTMHSKGAIRVAPILMGSKRGGLVQIVLGTVLVLVGTFTSVFSGGTSLFLVKMGYSMILGGIVQLLSPQPKAGKSKDNENTPNYAFNGPVNTTAQGYPVPVGYGRLIVGGARISGGISSSDTVYIPAIPTGVAPPEYGGGWNGPDPGNIWEVTERYIQGG